jgi:hypothetical protein
MNSKSSTAWIDPPAIDPDLKRGQVKVTRPDSETGEQIIEKVRADHFKPKLPKLPKVNEERKGIVCPDGEVIHTPAGVLYVFAVREEEIAYWEAHATTLTKEERSNLANARSTSSLRPIKPEWEIGERIEVATNVTAEVLEVVESFRGWGTVFKVSDFRPWYMKQVVGGSRQPRSDEQGYAAPVNKAEEEAARIDGNYTRSRHLAVPDTEDSDVMDDKLHQRLHAEAAMGNALKQWRGRARTSKMRLEQRLVDARKNHRRSTVRYLERQLEALDSKRKKAA